MRRVAIVLATALLLPLSSTPCRAEAWQGAPSISRVEPLSWWTGMKTPLQLMFYGNDLMGASVRCAQTGMSVTAVHDADSGDYLFVDVAIADDARVGVYTFEFTKGRRKWSYPYTLAARTPGSASRRGFDSRDAIYLVMPDRFANGDPSNDNIRALPEGAARSEADGRHGGDIRGIIDRLDYIAALGMTALWCTPLLLDNEPQFSYHGYACADYYTIDPRFGTRELYREMVAEGHRRGIKTIMDVVTNHCGTAHPWVAKAPFADWFNRFDTFTRTNHAIGSLSDPHAAPSDRRVMERGWFDTSMPDINLANPFVLRYFVQWAVWWIEWAGLDGLRVDTFPYNDPAAMSNWCASVLKEYPGLGIVGECWSASSAVVSWWEGANPRGGGSGLGAVMDFPLMTTLSEALAPNSEGSSGGGGPRKIYDVISRDFLYARPGSLMIMASNHDTDHLFNTLGSSPRRVMLALTMIATLRGMPQFWAGDEVLLAGKAKGSDGDRRVDFPGGWPGDTLDLFAPDGRSDARRQVHDHLSKLLHWRRGCEAARSGEMMHYVPDPGDDLYVYFRYCASGRVMVAVNTSEGDLPLDWSLYTDGLASVTAPVMAPSSQGVDILTGQTVIVGQNLTVPPLGAVVIDFQ